MKLPWQAGCFALLLFYAPASMAQSTPEPAKEAASASAPSAQEKEKRPFFAPQGFAQFIGPNTPVARKFQFGYFGMPYVLSPVTGEGAELHLLRGGAHQVFKKEGQGWRFVSSGPIPRPPDWAQAHPKVDPGQGPSETDKERNQRTAQISDLESAITGYQVDEKGTVYWIARQALFRRTEEGWRLVWTFSKELLDRRENPVVPGHIVVLSNNRIALVGTTDAFVKILEFSEAVSVISTIAGDGTLPSTNTKPKIPQAAGEPKVLHSIGYDSIDACAETMRNTVDVQYCSSGDHLFFYLGHTGRFFRLRLDSWSLTELDTPWIAQMGGATPNTPRKWRPSQGQTPPTPVLPFRVAFAPSPDGTVHARALMYNMEPAVIYSFELGSEGSSIKAQIHLENEMPEPIVLPDPRGDLVPIKKLAQPDRTAMSQNSEKPTDTHKAAEPAPKPYTPSSLPKEN